MGRGPAHPAPLALAVCLVLATIVVFVVYAVGSDRRGSGDPGGGRLAQLQALRAAIPGGAVIIDQGSEEPSWIGSCQEEHFHRGWAGVAYRVEFRPTLPRNQELIEISQNIADRGWRRTYAADAGWSWTRELASGSHASASLVLPASEGTWSISANATPAPPVGGCAGG